MSRSVSPEMKPVTLVNGATIALADAAVSFGSTSLAVDVTHWFI
jgi:hypothetical protein